MVVAYWLVTNVWIVGTHAMVDAIQTSSTRPSNVTRSAHDPNPDAITHVIENVAMHASSDAMLC